jgi:hypothetical protein
LKTKTWQQASNTSPASNVHEHSQPASKLHNTEITKLNGSRLLSRMHQIFAPTAAMVKKQWKQPDTKKGKTDASR